MLVLSYLGLLSLIPLLVEKEDQEVKWHAKHGLVQFFAFMILFVVLFILSWIPFLCFISILIPFVGLAYLVVAILSIVKAVNGQRFIIPGISQFADKF